MSSSDDDGDGGVYEPAVNAAPEARRTSSRQPRPVDRYQSIDFRR